MSVDPVFLLAVNKQNVYNDFMIQSFACKETERFFYTGDVEITDYH